MANGIFTLRNQLQSLVQKAWSGSQTTPAVEYLVVAGGGAGGNGAGGGGAAVMNAVLNASGGAGTAGIIIIYEYV